MPHLTLGVLGSLQFLVDRSPITTFGSDKARALLAYLAVEADHPHRREELVGLLWPDCPEQTARHNLRQTLLNIRRAIVDHTAKPPYLIVTRDEIQFNTASDYSLDVAAFNAYLAACYVHKHHTRKTCAECAARMQQAVELYRGKFLQQFFLEDGAEFEEWALIQRESLHRCVLEALARLVDYHEQCADNEQARRYASRQLELDPWREEAHRQMMRLLALSGERSAALGQYETCRRVLAEELGVEPAAETRELHAQIIRGELTTPRTEVPLTSPVTLRPLPNQLTPFIGRNRELETLGQLLADPHCRLITLVGPGGIGKTRLALQSAAQHQKAFTHGTAFIPLASASSTESIVPAIADALGLVFSGPGDPQVQIHHYLRDKQMLLVLDNVEHLLDSAGLFVELLQHAPALKVLCTSRESLHLQSEWVFEVEGLPIPENEQTEKFEEYGAVALFVQHARRTRVGYALTADERFGVTRICHLVEGLPLALELAATWVRTLSSREIADQIEQNVDFLATPMRDLPEWHRGVRAMFDQSWGMLTAEEQGVLSRLSGFRGGFQRQAAEQVAGASLSVLASLVAKSLVRRAGSGRYDLHELVRQYATAKLATVPKDQAITRDRHNDYYLSFVRMQEVRLCSYHQKESLAELAAEIDNVRLAIDWAIDQRQTSRLSNISFALLYFYEIRGLYLEGETLFHQAAVRLQSHQESDPLAETVRQIAHCDMQTSQAYFTYRLGKTAEADSMLRQCIDLLRSLGDRTVLRYSLRYSGLANSALGRLGEAETTLRECLALSQATDRQWDIAITNVYLGAVLTRRDALADAKPYLNKALKIGTSLGDPRLIAYSGAFISRLLLWLNQPAEAGKLLGQVLPLARDTGDRYNTGLILALLGRVAQAGGETVQARRLLEESIALFEEIGDISNLSEDWISLGNLTLGMGNIHEAEDYFRRGGQIAVEIREVILVLRMLLGLASVRSQDGDTEIALELIIQILQHPSCREDMKDRAKQLQTELKAQLTHEQIQAINLRAQAKTLEVVAQEVLAMPES